MPRYVCMYVCMPRYVCMYVHECLCAYACIICVCIHMCSICK
jgi:hypothetical protein